MNRRLKQEPGRAVDWVNEGQREYVARVTSARQAARRASQKIELVCRWSSARDADVDLLKGAAADLRLALEAISTFIGKET